MIFVMQLAGRATLLGDIVATPYDGQYLKDFDFEAAGGRGSILMTPDIEEAKGFADLAEAIAFHRRSPECRPLRDDGNPNRPLTSTNWTFIDRSEPA